MDNKIRLKNIIKIEKGNNTEYFDFKIKNSLPLLSMSYLRSQSSAVYSLIKNKNKISNEGDVLILWDGANAGEIIKSKYGILSSTLAKIDFNKDINKQYMFYSLKSKEYVFRTLYTGMGIPHVSGKTLKETTIRLPSNEEQTAIANFLDKKTGTIDRAVEELENQRRLLKELKQATIHKAVTKGLDDNVPMKDSGVEWIGEVPVSWKVNHLKNLINYTTGNTPSTTDESYYQMDGLYPWANISDLKSKFLQKTEKYLSKNGVNSKNMVLVPENSLLFAFKLSVGNSSINKIPVYTNEAIAAFKENKKINIEWLYYFMSILFKNNAKENIYGAPLLNRQLIENGLILEVPKKEQEKIVRLLNDKVSKIENSLEEIELKIKHLKEYKKTLINDAVTGKIKVYKGDA